MKFLLAVALATVAVSAQTQAAGQAPVCDADYIVTRCLSTESDKPSQCDQTDYDCLCYAYQAIATCYNNCPNDPRGAPAKNAADTHCQNASMYGTKANASKTATPGSSDSTAMPSAGAPITTADLNDGSQPTGTATDNGDFGSSPQKTNAAAPLDARGASVVGLAGIIAALL